MITSESYHCVYTALSGNSLSENVHGALVLLFQEIYEFTHVEFISGTKVMDVFNLEPSILVIRELRLFPRT